jgi:Haem-binding domain
MKQILGIAALLIIVLLVISSLQAAAKNRSNPPVIAEPTWDSPETRQRVERACFACHSNQTKWPIYSGLPVVGGFIEKHIIDGRSHLNFSEWGTGEQEGDEAAEKVFEPMHYIEEDPFPQPPYSLLHPEARLTSAEREQLARGFITTLDGEGGKENISEETGETERDDDD